MVNVTQCNPGSPQWIYTSLVTSCNGEYLYCAQASFKVRKDYSSVMSLAGFGVWQLHHHPAVHDFHVASFIFLKQE